MTSETALLREAQRFAEEVAIERRRIRPFEFDLPPPGIHPETLRDAALAEKIGDLSVAEARKLGIPKTTLWHQLRRLRNGAPVRVYRKVASRLARKAHPAEGHSQATPA